MTNLIGNGRDHMMRDALPSPEWTPEAIAAAGGNMEAMTTAERLARNAFPVRYALTGQEPDLLHRDAARIMEIVDRRKLSHTECQGLAMQTDSPSDRWYITFNEPDEAHAEQWFREASGGERELFRADEFEEFIARLDIATRRVILDIRNGFRVLVYSPPGEMPCGCTEEAIITGCPVHYTATWQTT